MHNAVPSNGRLEQLKRHVIYQLALLHIDSMADHLGLTEQKVQEMVTLYNLLHQTLHVADIRIRNAKLL